MPLPKVNSPSYPLTLPDSGKEITVRRVVSGEYKTLLNAIVSNDDDVIIASFNDIIPQCVKTPGFDFSELSFVDVEYLFLKLYSVGADDKIHVQYTCQNETEKGHCNTSFNVDIPIVDIIPSQQTKSNIIQVTNEVGIKLKYPTWSNWFKTQNKHSTDGDVLMQIVESVWEGDNVFVPGADFTKEELEDFVDNQTPEVAEKIIEFIQDMPTVSWSRQIKCPSCGKTETKTMKGLESFLD